VGSGSSGANAAGTNTQVQFNSSSAFAGSANLTWSSPALTIGAQQTTQGSLVLANTASGAYATTLKASNSATAAYTFTFPTTAGTANYVLQTDGSGNTSWVAQSGGISTLAINSTPTSGAAANDILISDGSKLQKLTPGTGVATALAQNANSATGPLVNGTTANLGAGYTTTIYTGIGTITSGTVTPSPANGQFQAYTNNGAHTLAPPSITSGQVSVIQVVITNGASAGAITTSGFSKVEGDTPTTTNGAVFEANIYAENAYSRLVWKGPR
jgi:hypothetical protein